MRTDNPHIHKINELLQNLYENPSMSIYSDLVYECGALERQTNNTYIEEKLDNIRIEAKMVATGRYDRGFTLESVKQHLLGDINNIESELIYRKKLADQML
ncbi:hypothetical protein SKP08_001986 [Vibrio fluvialis]|nr:hypothetical protein [Vibrio fluvialis]ELE8119514.1 hypothetical protein [Vibrio fluvialis]ELX7501920.1 hypothetical protein [Vibrio fluvialis]MBY7923605.1 hypothetical protein [Vibrio fluvialis]MBY7979407.1 hypothetical protein [Vibrio fluvialis]